MIILKFGGSSVGNSERINGVIDILSKYYLNNGKNLPLFSRHFRALPTN